MRWLEGADLLCACKPMRAQSKDEHNKAKFRYYDKPRKEVILLALNEVKIKTDELLLRMNDKYKNKYGIDLISNLWHISRCKEGFRCNSRFCPECSNKRSQIMYAEISALMKRIKKENRTALLFFITLGALPVPREQLAEHYKKISLASTNLLASSRQSKQTKPIKKYMLGYIKMIEVKYNYSDNTFNVHVHIIIAMKSTYKKSSECYINITKWKKIWQDLLKVAYIPDVKQTEIKENKKSFVESVATIAGYGTKGIFLTTTKTEYYDDENIKDMIVFMQAIKKKKFISYGGIFKQ